MAKIVVKKKFMLKMLISGLSLYIISVQLLQQIITEFSFILIDIMMVQALVIYIILMIFIKEIYHQQQVQLWFQDGLNNVEVYSKLSITGSLAFRNSDDSEIVDANNNVELRQVNSSGDLVASRAVLSSDKQTFTIIPDQMLSTNSTYWYGIKDNTTNYAGGASVSGVSGTFSTSQVLQNLLFMMIMSLEALQNI